MKNIISILLAVTLYSFGTTQTASAIFCSNCSNIVTQLLEHGEAILNTGSNVASAIETKLDMMNKYVLDPMANAMLAAVQIQKQLNTINFVTAVFGNEGALLIQNPEAWIQNKGKAQVQIALGNIQQQNGLYKDSLLASVIGTYKSADDLNKTLQDLSKSNVPNAIQKNICNQTSLTNLAKNDVMRSDGSYDPGELQAKMADLDRQLCRGNPATNVDLARTLNMVNEQLPSIGGWDVWLFTTGGDNSYTNTTRANIAIAKKVEDAKLAKRDELNRNGGIANKTECSPDESGREQRAFSIDYDIITDTPGAPQTLPCIAETITQTGNALNSQFQEALNAPLKKLQSSFGPGIYKSIGNIMSIVGSMRELSSAFSATGAPTNAAPSSTQITATQDLSSPQRQTQVSDPTKESLSKHLDSLNKLQNVENNFRASLDNYDGQINGIKQCFEGVIATYPQLAGDNRKTLADTYVASAMAYSSSLRQQGDDITSKITTTRNLITETQSFIDSSKSTEEIMNKYKEYQNAIDTQKLPTFATSLEREGEFQKFLAYVRQETRNIDGDPGGIPYHKNQCDGMRPTIQIEAGSTGG